MIGICSRTARHLRALLQDTGHTHVLLSVSGGGCNGLKYNVTTESDQPKKHDEELVVDGVPLRICGKSMLYLVGMKITWITDAMGSRMEFSNPNAASSCGCGETFNVKDI